MEKDFGLEPISGSTFLSTSRLFAWIAWEKIKMSKNHNTSLREPRLQHDAVPEFYGPGERRGCGYKNKRIRAADCCELCAAVTIFSVLHVCTNVRRGSRSSDLLLQIHV